MKEVVAVPRLKAHSWSQWTLEAKPPLRADVAGLIRRYVGTRRVKCVSSVVNREERWIVRWAVFLGETGIRLDVATLDDALAFVPNFDKWDWSSSQRRQFISALRGFHDFLDRRGDARGNPWRHVPYPREVIREPRVLTAEECQRLLGAFDGSSWRDVRDRAAILFLWETGCRVSEAVGLNLEDIDLDRCQALVMGKGSRERTVPFTGRTAMALRAYMEVTRAVLANSRSVSALFLGQRGRRVHDDVIREGLNRAASRAGIPKHLWPHLLRHTYATQMLEAGVDLRYVQHLLGHTNIRSTERYTHVSGAKVRTLYDQARETIAHAAN